MDGTEANTMKKKMIFGSNEMRNTGKTDSTLIFFTMNSKNR